MEDQHPGVSLYLARCQRDLGFQDTPRSLERARLGQPCGVITEGTWWMCSAFPREKQQVGWGSQVLRAAGNKGSVLRYGYRTPSRLGLCYWTRAGTVYDI